MEKLSLSVQNSYYNASASKMQVKNQTSLPSSVIITEPPKEPRKGPSFTAAAAPVMTSIRTELTTPEEKKKYTDILSVLDKNDKKTFEMLLKSGRLLNNKSNDNTSTLDNLHKMLTTPRAQGLSPKMVLKETIATIANPFIITQKFGDIPQQYTLKAIEAGKEASYHTTNLIERYMMKLRGEVDKDINEKTIDVKHSASCVAASIEFDLASRMPAEFVRFAEGLSSPKMAVDKNIQLKNLSENTLDAIWLLNNFKVPYKLDDFNGAKLTFAPDEGALFRAQIQQSHKDRLERSLVDVLMQSTFLNVGSQQTYNSLTDKTKSQFNPHDNGLIEFEKTFTESIAEDKNEVSVIYQKIDDDGKLVGYEKDFQTTKKEILGTLAMGHSVLIGYTFTDKNNIVVGGHEITIVGAKQEKNGKLTFICNDTDDDNPNPITYSEDYIIPKIHHAGIPQEIAEQGVTVEAAWVDSLNAYKMAKEELKKQPQAQRA